MDEKIFREICENKLKELNLNDEIHKKRLNEELKEIFVKDEIPYFVDLIEKKEVYDNEHNLLVPFLLGIVQEFNINQEYKFDFGDFPDVDIDYVPEIRDYLKNEYCPKAFDENKVCNICTYTKFGIRSSLIDMARVLGLDRKEIMVLTKSLKVKDDEGEVLTWDKALELYDDLREYLEKHPDLAEAAKKLLNRIRGMGVHASGLIISNVNIKEFVPLVMPKQKDNAASAWVEGLGGSDLGAVGLVKFDFLGLDATKKIGQARHYAKELFKEARKEYLETGKLPSNKYFKNQIDKEELTISALPGQKDFSDLSYLNDPETLAMSNSGKLKMVFQFDGSPGIRSLAKQGGVTRFEDIPAYASLFRPGPLKADAHTMYCKRNKGLEEPECHPKLYDILGPTHGLLIYQEQIMKLLHRVGKIPLKDCEAIRKAISKKKTDKFKKARDLFVENGQIFLEESKEYLEKLFDKIIFFSGYGFNLSHAVAYSYITIQEMYLKTHLPEAYFTSYLDVFKPKKTEDYAKMKEYLSDVKSCGVKINRININESKSYFRYDFKNQNICYPFNKLKGVGEEVSKSITKFQPYADFTDFLDKFGTSAKTCQALIAIGAFQGNRLVLWEYYENYVKWKKIKKGQEKSYPKHCEKFREQIKKITGEDLEIELDDNAIEYVYQMFPEGHKHYSRTRKMIKPFIRIVKNLKITKPVLDLTKESVEIEKKQMKDLLSLPIEEAEKMYLGFVWTNPIEEAVGINQTFDNLEEMDGTSGPVEVLIEKCEKKKAKTGNAYYSVKVQDALETTKFLTIWSNDYDQFQEEFVVGNIVRIYLQKPDPNSRFSNYLMKSTPNRFRLPEKSMDYRMKVIKWRQS